MRKRPHFRLNGVEKIIKGSIGLRNIVFNRKSLKAIYKNFLEKEARDKIPFKGFDSLDSINGIITSNEKAESKISEEKS